MSGPLGRQVGSSRRGPCGARFAEPALLAPSLLFPLFLLAVNAGGLDAATRVPGLPRHLVPELRARHHVHAGGAASHDRRRDERRRGRPTGFLTRLSLTPLRGVAPRGRRARRRNVACAAAVRHGNRHRRGGRCDSPLRRAGGGRRRGTTVLITNAFAAVGVFWALRAGSGEAVQALFPLLFVVFFLSSMFLPRELITTTWFRAVATANPLSYMIEGLRSLIVSGWTRRRSASPSPAPCCSRCARRRGASAAHEDGAPMTAHDRSVAARAVARRHLQLALRQPSVLLPPLLFAVFFFVAFVGGLGAIGVSPAFAYPDFKAFVFVFVALQSAAFGGVFVGVALAGDLESGAVGRLALAAPRRGPILAGYVLASVLRGA